MLPFELHTHSLHSDGSDTPSQLVQKAQAAGLSLLALTDHDTVAGVAEARREGERLQLPVLSGIEIDTDFDGELHILGLGVNTEHPELIKLIEGAALRRRKRNAEILRRLQEIGVDYGPYLEPGKGTATRLHIALAIVRCGAAKDVNEAFERYLRRGCPGNVPCKRPEQEEVIGVIHAAGGLAVLAHPCKLRCDPTPVVRSLAAAGLDGLEAYYPTATAGQTLLFRSLASQLGLLVTCGSDYHGKNRQVALGAAFQDAPELLRAYERLTELL